MSEIARVLGEVGATAGQEKLLCKADTDLIMDALRHYGEHLLTCATTVRIAKPQGVDRRPVAAHLETVSARANLVANLIDVSRGVAVKACGED